MELPAARGILIGCRLKKLIVPVALNYELFIWIYKAN